jgi:hypothetical protein
MKPVPRSVNLALAGLFKHPLRRRCKSIKASEASCFLGMYIPSFRRRLVLPFSAS